MKKNVTKMLAMLTIVATVSCSEDLAENVSDADNSGDIEKVCITGKNFQFEKGTRSSVSVSESGVSFLWNANDTVGIFPNTGDQVSFAMQNGEGAQSATFSGGGWALKSSATYAAYYPYNFFNRDLTCIPVSYEGQTQSGNGGTGHIGAYDFMAARVATPSNGTVAFDMLHLGCLVRLNATLGEDTELHGVTITLTDENVRFTKNGYIDLTSQTPAILASLVDGESTSVSVSLEDFSVASDEAAVIYFMMPPVNLEDKELEITISKGDSESKTYQVLGKNFVAGIAYSYTLVDKVSEPYSWYVNAVDNLYEISTAEELVEFSKLTNGDSEALAAVGADAAVNFAEKTVRLKSNIDLSGHCSAQLGSWTPIASFKGTFDGNGKTISNMYVNATKSAGLFSSVVLGRVCNLNVNGVINSPENSGGNLGGITASADYSVIENCIADVTITTETFGMNACIGGICGDASSSTIIACQSLGNITDKIDEWEWANSIGGIVGYLSNNSCVIACAKTNGEVKETRTQSYTAVGGIVGQIPTSSYKEKIVACYSNVYIDGRMPGHILGNCTYRSSYGTPSISASFYSGSSGEFYGNKGIGCDNYSGSSRGYDHGTTRVNGAGDAIDAMNEEIDKWNAANPEKACNYKYAVVNEELMLVKQN